MALLRVVFNWDSTLVTIEGSIALAKHKGIAGVEDLMNQAMNGEISLRDTFLKRFDLLRPTLKDMRWLSNEYAAHITPGAKEVITALCADGHEIYIVSSADRTSLIEPAVKLGIPALNICAVDILFDEQGEHARADMENVLVSDGGMELVLAEIAKGGPTIYVGDSVPDAQASAAVDFFIGFGGVVPRDEVAKSASVYVREPTLLPVLGHVRKFANSQLRSSGSK